MLTAMQKLEQNGENGCHFKNESNSHLFVFTNEKAGMAELDKQRINQVIWECSKNSKYVKHAQRQDEKVNIRVSEMKKKISSTLSHKLKISYEENADRLAMELEAKSAAALKRVCVVVDMDMFYAAVEIRDRPELKELPVAVGGMGMISTANYIARRFGVRSAMPGFIGKKLCPELVFIAPDFDKYTQVAEQTREIFRTYDSKFRAFSLDEAYLDVTEHLKERWLQNNSGSKAEAEIPFVELYHMATEVVSDMRAKIFEVTQLTASAGIAQNFMLAKICSDIKKPNGQHSAPFQRSEVLAFIKALPVRKIPGIGKVTEKTLHELGITSCSDIFEQRGTLLHVLTERTAQFLISASLGISLDFIPEENMTEVSKAESRKSISHERTFSDISNAGQLLEICKDICEVLAEDLKQQGLKATNITVKIKTADFDVKTRAGQSQRFIDNKEGIFKIASKLLLAELPLKLRLLGVRASNFEPSKADKNSSAFLRYFSQKRTSEGDQDFEDAQKNVIFVEDEEHQQEGNQLAGVVLCQAQKKRTERDADDSLISLKSEASSIKCAYQTLSSLQQPSNSSNALLCPVCDSFLHFGANDCAEILFNQHIDECLSLLEISRIQKEARCSNAKVTTKKNLLAIDRPALFNKGANPSKKTTKTKKQRMSDQLCIEHFVRTLKN